MLRTRAVVRLVILGVVQRPGPSSMIDRSRSGPRAALSLLHDDIVSLQTTRNWLFFKYLPFWRFGEIFDYLHEGLEFISKEK